MLCLDNHHGASIGWYPIQSVPQGNRGEKLVICEGLFLRRNVLNILGGQSHLCKREVAPDTPEGGLGILREEVFDLTLLTGGANCVTIFKCQGHRLLL